MGQTCKWLWSMRENTPGAFPYFFLDFVATNNEIKTGCARLHLATLQPEAEGLHSVTEIGEDLCYTRAFIGLLLRGWERGQGVERGGGYVHF